MRLRGSRGRGASAPADWLIVGLGNPGTKYAATRHNAGFEAAALLAERWGLPKAKRRFSGLVTEGRTGPGGPRVAVLLPQTFMNESGKSVGPARGSYGVPLDRVIVLHDELDIPFGDVRTRLGGGTAGHNGLKSLRSELGGTDFQRVRIGIGRPDTTDRELVSSFVLGRFTESDAAVRALFADAADAVERLIAVEAATGPEGD